VKAKNTVIRKAFLLCIPNLSDPLTGAQYCRGGHIRNTYSSSSQTASSPT